MVKLMLDPGHDRGKYNRSPVVPEYWEGERMWRLYQMLAPALRSRGFEVGCTKHQCDEAVEVTVRGRKAAGYGALISLHTNACADPSVNRPIGIHLVNDGCAEIDTVSRELAMRLSEVVEQVMGTSPAEQYARLSDRDRDGDGKVNDDYYGVLYGAHQVGVAAVILEISFHTCAASAAWLMDDKNLAELAAAMADELAEYYGLPNPVKEEGTTVTMKTLRKGDCGDHVRVMQALLIGYGYDCGQYGADGHFGGATESALRKYQSRSGLTPDAVAGPKTWGKLLAQ